MENILTKKEFFAKIDEETKKDKKLLLKDLCARLPYGVICCVTHKKNGSLVKEDMKLSGIFENGDFYFLDEMGSTYSDNYIPYLRPMSSMTEEEKEDYNNARSDYYDDLETYDWLNEHHFDYRGLIEKCLAIEAPKNMYKEQNGKVEH